MINSVRAVRKAKGMTLEEVASRCVPPTTPQTIGRLETGMRRLSLPWLKTIADALQCSEAELVRMPEDASFTVTAILGSDGAAAPARTEEVPPLRLNPDMLVVRVNSSVGDYRAGDLIYCDRINTEALSDAKNRDVLMPRPAGRYFFGRLLDTDGTNVQILPLASGQRQIIIPAPAWAAVAKRLVRSL